jgi:hypothetical protein
MISRILNYIFVFITSRPMFIIIGAILFVSSIPMIAEQWYFLRSYWSIEPTKIALDEVEELIDGLAGILVAAGVFFEERETIRKINAHKEETHPTQIYLNEVAHHNGMGILLLGLFMEIGTQAIRLPERLISINHTVEKYIFVACLLMSIISLVILFDFLKDYFKTYFIAQYRTPTDAKPHDH